MRMETITKKLKESICKGAKCGITYERTGLKKVIEEYSGMRFGIDYQESHLAGTLAALIKKEKLISPERGKYLVIDTDKEDLKFDFEFIFPNEENKPNETRSITEVNQLARDSVKKEVAYLKEITSNVNISLDKVDKDDINNVMKIKELIEYLEGFHLV